MQTRCNIQLSPPISKHLELTNPYFVNLALCTRVAFPFFFFERTWLAYLKLLILFALSTLDIQILLTFFGLFKFVDLFHAF